LALVRVLLREILSLDLLLLLFTSVLVQGFFVRLMLVDMSAGLIVVSFFVGAFLTAQVFARLFI
jgi:hypothetical protein